VALHTDSDETLMVIALESTRSMSAALASCTVHPYCTSILYIHTPYLQNHGAPELRSLPSIAWPRQPLNRVTVAS
jgi:hypothetical protein